jgi:hypothetical protein
MHTFFNKSALFGWGDKQVGRNADQATRRHKENLQDILENVT